MRYLILTSILTSWSLCEGATITVDHRGRGDYLEIQEAIDAARDGDEVVVRPGEYVITEPIDFNRGVGEGEPKNIVLRSEGGVEVTIVRMEADSDAARSHVVRFQSGESAASLLEGFTLTGGRAHTGGGIRVDGMSAVVVSDCVITRNRARNGGGVACRNGSSATFRRCEIVENLGGGVHCSGSRPRFIDCEISRNSEGRGGAFTLLGAPAELVDCVMESNVAAFGGGVFVNGSVPASLSGCLIAGNTAEDGGGVYVFSGARTRLERCTIAGNTNGGLTTRGRSFVEVESSILWGNAGGSLSVGFEAEAAVSFSCVEGETVLPGEGNINDDPLLCGWGDKGEVFVDAAADGDGDGTADRPYRDLGPATGGYSLALSASSPCLGRGEDGVDMGADTGRCEEPGAPWRVVHFAAGTYSAADLQASYGVSLEGASRESVVIEGALSGLRTGASLSGLTVIAGARGGIRVPPGESPAISDCLVSGNTDPRRGGSGIRCGEGSSPTIERCTIGGNLQGVYCLPGSTARITECEIGGATRGGILCEGSAPRVASSTIEGNRGSEGGGVVCTDGATPLFLDCRILGNSARDGGGIFSEDAAPRFEECLIARNRTGDLGAGGGAALRGGSPVFTRCRFFRNTAGQGGAVNGGGVFRDCVFVANVADYFFSSRGPDAAIFGADSLEGCTVTANIGGGVYGGSLTIESSILWGNVGAADLTVASGSSPVVSHSLIGGESPFPGEGNINDDPLLCGWPGPAEVHVDASAPGPGAGSEDDPFSDLATALDSFSLALSTGSPCIGTGKDGRDMGAQSQMCDSPGPGSRLVRLAPGTYSLRGQSLVHDVSLRGAGREDTAIEGTVYGLRSGAGLFDLTVTRGESGGVRVLGAESPEIRGCAITGNTGDLGGGVYCADAARPEICDCLIAENSAGRGGGVYVREEGAPVFRRSTISENTAKEASGVYAESGLETFEDCRIVGNRGAGIYVLRGSRFTRCTVAANEGVGIVCEDPTSPVFTDCRVTGNRLGGIALKDRSSAEFVNCVIDRNVSIDSAGIRAEARTTPRFLHCTITGNADGGFIHEGDGEGVRLTSCILWGNTDGDLRFERPSAATVAFSAVGSAEVWPGEGNINASPLFCGWEGGAEVHVDASAPEGGDGSAGRPYRTLAEALEPFRLLLSPGSPCLGAGRDGADMGAPLGTCAGEPVATRRIHLAAGAYDVRGRPLTHGVSIAGAGSSVTTLRGTVYGLRTGSMLSDLAITDGKRAGLRVGPGESPEIARTRIFRNRNRFSFPGGGVWCGPGSAPLFRSCAITQNWAGGGGGGLYVLRADPVLADCEISSNSSGQGGGIRVTSDGSLELRRCVVAGNHGHVGAGVKVDWGAQVALENSIVFANHASAGEGIGVRCAENTTVELMNCTVVSNTGPALSVEDDAFVTVTNSIVRGETTSIEASARWRVGVSHSLVTGQTPWPGDGNVELDPRFAREGTFDFDLYEQVTVRGVELEIPRYVVRQPDLHLREDSPAIDAGTAAGAPATDLDGTNRPCGGGVDMGALEFCGPPPFQRGDVDASGSRNITDPVVLLLFLFRGGAEPPCVKAADADDDGRTSITDAVFLLEFLFRDGRPPAEPRSCGSDPTDDDLGCASYSPCGG